MSGFFKILLIVLSMMKIAETRRISKTSCGSEAAFYRIASDHILDEEPIAKEITYGLEECVDLCVNVSICVAMNIHKTSNSKMDCHLLRDDHMSKPKKITPKKGWSLYDTGSKAISRAVGSRCLAMTVNPCPSHCTCVDTCSSYRCDCYGPEIYKSCRHALTEHPNSNLFFWIKPEGMSKAVYAQCRKNSDTTYSAFIGHDTERTRVSGYEGRGSYIRKFTYPINAMEDIIAFVTSSGNCRQFTRFECYNTVLAGYTWLLGRNGIKLNYIGGGPANGTGCACGITNSCHYTSQKCNCDANIGTLLIDEGYVAENSVLPLTEIRMGDTGSSYEYADFTIGKLECHDIFKSCAEALSSYPGGGPHHWIKPDGADKATYTRCTA